MPRRPTLQERVLANMRPGTMRGSLANAGPVVKPERPETWRGATNPGGGGRPYATRVVAAANSTAIGAEHADYVCDGTNDQIDIQAAIDDIAEEAGLLGGKVLLLEGVYNVATAGTAAIAIRNGVHLQGMGVATQIALVTGAGATSQPYIIAQEAVTGGQLQISDLSLDLGSGHVRAASGIIGEAIGQSFIERVQISGTGGGTSGTAVGISLTQGGAEVTMVVISDCIVTGPARGYTLRGQRVFVRNCHAVGGSSDGFVIDPLGDSALIGCAAHDCGGYGFYIDQGSAVSLIGCEATENTLTGILVNSGRALIVGCHVADNGQHGIWLADDALRSAVRDCYVVDNSQTTTNTYDGILLNAPDYASVIGCRVWRGTGNQHRYGINVASGTLAAFITTNDLENAGSTGNFNDAGTSTVTAAGNRV